MYLSRMHINIVVRSHYTTKIIIKKQRGPSNIFAGLTGGLKTSKGFFLVHNIFININGKVLFKAVEGLGTI